MPPLYKSQVSEMKTMFCWQNGSNAKIEEPMRHQVTCPQQQLIIMTFTHIKLFIHPH